MRGYSAQFLPGSQNTKQGASVKKPIVRQSPAYNHLFAVTPKKTALSRNYLVKYSVVRVSRSKFNFLGIWRQSAAGNLGRLRHTPPPGRITSQWEIEKMIGGFRALDETYFSPLWLHQRYDVENGDWRATHASLDITRR